jgi:site-specific DNA-methyltransferase (adenine-specific)
VGTVSGRILQGDARKALQLVDQESVHLVMTSPPYNVGIDYDTHDDEIPYEEWGELLRDVFTAAWETLVPGGRMVVNIPQSLSMPDANNRIPVGNAVESMLLDLDGALYRGGLVWYKRNANSSTAWGSWDSPSNPVLRGTYEMLYVVSRGRPDRPDRKGKGDLPKRDFLKASLDVWEIAPYSDHSLHPAPYPVELVRRVLQFFTWQGDHVLDPFAGSGTTALAAEHLGRDWTMIDVSERYCKTMQQRTMVFEGIPTAEIEVV